VLFSKERPVLILIGVHTLCFTSPAWGGNDWQAQGGNDYDARYNLGYLLQKSPVQMGIFYTKELAFNQANNEVSPFREGT